MPNGFSFITEIKKKEAKRLEEEASKEKNSTKKMELLRKARELEKEARYEDFENGFD